MNQFYFASNQTVKRYCIVYCNAETTIPPSCKTFNPARHNTTGANVNYNKQVNIKGLTVLNATVKKITPRLRPQPEIQAGTRILVPNFCRSGSGLVGTGIFKLI